MYLIGSLAAVTIALQAEGLLAQETEPNKDRGVALMSCVEEAKAKFPGPDYTERYEAIANCQQAHPYTYDPANSTVNPGPPVEQPDFGKMREIAEGHIRSLLIDPNSAEFSWPHGFTNSSWKPLLRKRVEGFVTCGFVNAKNRMGGYVGKNAFVIVMNDYRVDFAQLGDGGSYDLVAGSCAKSAGRFVAPQAGMLSRAAESEPNRLVGVADELAKLADLRDRGVISSEEFEEQKSKLLSD